MQDVERHGRPLPLGLRGHGQRQRHPQRRVQLHSQKQELRVPPAPTAAPVSTASTAAGGPTGVQFQLRRRQRAAGTAGTGRPKISSTIEVKSGLIFRYLSTLWIWMLGRGLGT